MAALASHFDSVILGDSFGSRIAAALLARGGRRILVVHDEPDATPPPAWPLGSLLLDRILQRLDGRSVLTRAPRLHVLSGTVRLELNGRAPLAEELRRELGSQAPPATEVLRDLEEFGTRLAALFWECGGLPLSGAAGRLRFSARALQRGLPARRLEQPLERRLATLVPTTADLLRDLLPALCRTPARELTLGEAALAWHAVRHSDGVSAAGLEELLAHRYRQFHGSEEQLSALAKMGGGGPGVQLHFVDGRTVTADTLIFARADLVRRFHWPGHGETAPPSAGALRLPVGEKVSPILADRVLLGGAPPLRLSFSGTGGGRELVVEWPGEISREDLKSRLGALLPFAEIGIGDLPPAPSSPAGGLMGAVHRIRLGRRAFLCGPCSLPAPGWAGEVLTAWSVANFLLGGPGKDGG